MDRDRELLEAFCDYLCQIGALKVNDPVYHRRWSGAFLASRPRTIHTPDGIPVECCRHGLPAGQCAECAGGSSGEMPASPARGDTDNAKPLPCAHGRRGYCEWCSHPAPSRPTGEKRASTYDPFWLRR